MSQPQQLSNVDLDATVGGDSQADIETQGIDDGETAIPMATDEAGDLEDAAAAKLTSLPISKMKLIMKADPDTRLLNREAVLAVAVATEQFVQQLSRLAHEFTVKAKRKTVTKKDVELAITWHPSFAFLEGAF